MEEIKIRIGGRTSTVFVGESVKNLSLYADLTGSIIITDENIYRHYSHLLAGYRCIVIGTGERIKTLTTVEYILGELVKAGAHRKTLLVGIGGGVVCDIAGFAASIYMRGIRFGFVSTSLLSQVDASVGGKNGVNLGGLKNMAGVINQPEFVICDHEMLATLPDEEYINGMAELIKTACLDNNNLFSYISDNREKLLSRNPETISHAVLRSVSFKARIVEEDEREENIRRILNFGHTIGHSIEKVNGVQHGFAVSAGMGFALSMSQKNSLINNSTVSNIISLINYFGLPASPAEVSSAGDIPLLMDAIENDKKKGSDTISFILLKDIAQPLIRDIRPSEIRGHLETCLVKNGGLL